MARKTLVVFIIVLLNVLVGCHSADSGRAQLLPSQGEHTISAADVIRPQMAAETDIIEQVSINRQGYRLGLKRLAEYYSETGNNMKSNWAKKELKALTSMPQYNYIIEASLSGPNLKAQTSIPEADYLYRDAVLLEKQAKKLVVYTNANTLRLALDKYNQLISKHPASDKLDDAAYKAAGIYKHFKDYSIALLYYQRVYQWNPQTPYSARFKAACILDRHLQSRTEALELYRQALEKEKLGKKDREFVEERIEEFTKSAEKE